MEKKKRKRKCKKGEKRKKKVMERKGNNKHGKKRQNKERKKRKKQKIAVKKWMKRMTRDSKDRIYASIAKIKAAILGMVNEKAYEILMIAITLQKETKETSEAMNRLEMMLLKKVTKDMRMKKQCGKY